MTAFTRGFRLVAMLTMTFMFFLVEIVFGYISHSVALVADSFHMLSDVLALLIAFGCMKIAQRSSRKNTFGWVRAEVLGALINGVFLLALCFSIFIEAVTRMVEPEMIKEPRNVLIVGVIGLVINLIGMMMFHSHAGHSHGRNAASVDASHNYNDDEEKLAGGGEEETAKATIDKAESRHLIGSHSDRAMALARPHRTAELEAVEESLMTSSKGKRRVKRTGSHMKGGESLNMHGVFLHILSDAIGSLIVIATALVAWLVEGYDWLKLYMDPGLSMIMVCLMVFTTFPLVRETALILLQTTPKFVEVEKLKEELLKIDGIMAVHEFHVWRLVGERIIATVHIRFASLRHYVSSAEKIRSIFHHNHIHNATIQPEFSEMLSTSGPDMECKLACLPNNCHLSSEWESGVTCCRAKPITELQSVVTSTAAAIELEDVMNGNGDVEENGTNGDELEDI